MTSGLVPGTTPAVPTGPTGPKYCLDDGINPHGWVCDVDWEMSKGSFSAGMYCEMMSRGMGCLYVPWHCSMGHLNISLYSTGHCTDEHLTVANGLLFYIGEYIDDAYYIIQDNGCPDGSQDYYGSPPCNPSVFIAESCDLLTGWFTQAKEYCLSAHAEYDNNYDWDKVYVPYDIEDTF